MLQKIFSVSFLFLFVGILSGCAVPVSTANLQSDIYVTSPSASKSIAKPQANKVAKATVSPDDVIDIDKETLDSVEYGRDKDLWSRIRRGFAMPDLNNNIVQRQISAYARRPSDMQKMIGRSSRYLFYIVEEIERRHMPMELALLPFIESAYNPQALSVAKAAGMWQFIPSTGKTYNLRQNIFRDERRDVMASTVAALDYLSKLHSMFNDWQLALAAYNWGERNVQRAIDNNRARGLPTNYESLRMPLETRYYFPKLEAVKSIIASPANYNLVLPEIPNHPYFVSVTTSRDLDISLAAQLAGLSASEFKALNPSFKKPIILGVDKPKILLPYENAETFERNLKLHEAQDKPLATWTTYTLEKQTRPDEIARHVGMSVNDLLKVNNIPPGMRLKAGSTLLVQKDPSVEQDISAAVANNAVLVMEPDIPATRKISVRVHNKAETLASVARHYHVTVAQVKEWNNLKTNTLKTGQVLSLNVPNRRSVVLAARKSKKSKRQLASVHTNRRMRVALKTTKRYHATIAQNDNR